MELPGFLWQGKYGEILLTGHRIGLYTVVRTYGEGRSAEEIHEEFPSLPVELVRDVIAFYHANRAEVDRYMAETRAELDRQEAMPRRGLTLEELRRRRDARLGAEGSGTNAAGPVGPSS